MKKSWVCSAILSVAGWTAILGVGRAEPPAQTDETKPYVIAVAAAPQAPAAGTAAAYQLTVTPSAPWTLKPETPFKAVLQATAGIVLSKVKLTAEDFLDRKSAAKTVKTTFAAKAKGAQSIEAELTFFLCTNEICQRYQDTTALAVEIK